MMNTNRVHTIKSPSFFIGKADKGVLSFGSGQPDLMPPATVFDVLSSIPRKSFQYAPVRGLLEVRELLAEHYVQAVADNFVITNGASEALDLTLRALCILLKQKIGAKVLIPRPYYYSYPHNVLLAGFEVDYYQLNEEGNIDLADITQQVQNENVVALIINSPSNPTGTVQPIDTLKKIEHLAKKHSLYVLSDEVYKDIIYERKNYLIEGDKVITINSFSKTFSMCGMRVGYLYSRNADVIQQVIEMKTHTSMNTNTIAQQMAIAALNTPIEYLEEQKMIWKSRRDILYQGLLDLNLDLWKPEGAFYVMPKVDDAEKIMHELYFHHQIIVYNGAWFGAPQHIRLSYALDKEKILQGLSRLKQYFNRSVKT